MRQDSGGNIERLQEAGYTIKTPLPAEYEAVIEELTGEQIDLLISIKNRFDEVEAATSPDVGHISAYVLGPTF